MRCHYISGKKFWILASYPGHRSMPVLEALLAFIINGPVTSGFLNRKTAMRDWLYCWEQIWVLNTMVRFCKEAFYIGPTELSLV